MELGTLFDLLVMKVEMDALEDAQFGGCSSF